VVLLVVWIAVVVVAAVVLGGLLLSLRGARQRLQRELDGLQQDLAPALEEVARTRARAAEVTRSGAAPDAAGPSAGPGRGTPAA
jgi:hypothetical protein